MLVCTFLKMLGTDYPMYQCISINISINELALNENSELWILLGLW